MHAHRVVQGVDTFGVSEALASCAYTGLWAALTWVALVSRMALYIYTCVHRQYAHVYAGPSVLNTFLLGKSTGLLWEECLFSVDALCFDHWAYGLCIVTFCCDGELDCQSHRRSWATVHGKRSQINRVYRQSVL